MGIGVWSDQEFYVPICIITIEIIYQMLLRIDPFTVYPTDRKLHKTDMCNK